MLLSLRVLLCIGILGFTVSCIKEPTSPPGWQSLALGNKYACSQTFSKSHCFKTCRGSSGKWCYTVKYISYNCTIDKDCRWMSHCQGWCAWNSPGLCVRNCNENVFKPEGERSQCEESRPWWKCQISHPGGAPSQIASEGKWISPDIPNDHVMNTEGNSITFNGNKATAAKESSTQLRALWYPMGEIKTTTTTFYWSFTIHQTGTSSESVSIGLSDLERLASGGDGLFYRGPDLSDGSGPLIADFGPKLTNGDKLSFVVKLLESRMKVYIILNGKPLGLAFDVPENTLNGIYPVVKFYGKGYTVEIHEGLSSDAPKELDLVKPIIMETEWTPHSLGKFVVTNSKVIMKITEMYDQSHGKAYGLSIQAVNKFMGKLFEKSKSHWVAEIIDKKVKNGTALEMELEEAITKHIKGIRNVVFDHLKGELRLESAYLTSVWKYIKAKKTTVTHNPFKKTQN